MVLAGSEGFEGMKVGNITPQEDCYVFTVGHGEGFRTMSTSFRADQREVMLALRARESDVAPCMCSRDQTISTAAVLSSLVCTRTQSRNMCC